MFKLAIDIHVASKGMLQKIVKPPCLQGVSCPKPFFPCFLLSLPGRTKSQVFVAVFVFICVAAAQSPAAPQPGP